MDAGRQREGFFHRIGRWLHLVKAAPGQAGGPMAPNAPPVKVVPPTWTLDTTDSVKVSEALSQVGGGTDMRNMQFRLMFEVDGKANQLSRKMQALGWEVNSSYNDCSHNTAAEVHGVKMADKTERSRSYSRVSTPYLTLAGSGLENLKQGFETLQAAGCVVGTTAAMRIWVPMASVPEDAAKHLLNLHRSYDDIIYRMAAGCGGGRSMEHKTYFARPTCLNLEAAPCVNSSAYAFYNAGLNRYSGANWEFRYFDSTMLAAAAGAHVALTLSLLKAAMEGRGDGQSLAPHGKTKDDIFAAPVKHERLETFLDVVAGQSGLREVMSDQFKRGGGLVTQPEVVAPAS